MFPSLSRPASAGACQPVTLGASDAGGTGRVMMLASPARSEPLRALLRRLVPQCHVRVASNLVDAVCQLSLHGVDLIVFDLDHETEQPRAFVQLLARMAPSAAILMFSDQEAPLPIAPYVCMPWSRAEESLRCALARHLRTARRGDCA